MGKIYKKIVLFIVTTVLLNGLGDLRCAYGISKEDINIKLDNYYNTRSETTAGLSVGVFSADDSLKKDYGFINIENKSKVDDSTIFEWGSVSKMLIWVSLMKLEEEGKVDFNDDIDKYIGVGFLKNKGNRKITILDLMNHKAGFEELLYEAVVNDKGKIRSLEDALKSYEPQIVYEVGKVTSYSNYGAALAAYIVEVVSKESFISYVNENIFKPLNMKDTVLDPKLINYEKLDAKRNENSSYIIMDNVYENLGTSRFYLELYPAGSVMGTMNDFMKFGKSLISGSDESKKLFKSQKTIEKFFTATDFYENTKIPKNSHGMWYLPYGEGVIGHSGNTYGYSSSLYIDWKNRTGIVIMTNESSETSYNYGLLEEIFGSYKLDKTLVNNGDSENNSEEKDPSLSGIFLNSRSQIKTGVGKIFGYIGTILPLKSADNLGNYKSIIGDLKLNKISKGVYILDNGNGCKSLMALGTYNGNIKFDGYTATTFKENTLLYILKILLFLLFIFGAVLSIIILITYFINIVIRKRKVKNNLDFIGVHIWNAFLGITVFILLFSDFVKNHKVAAIFSFFIIIISVIIGYLYINKRLRVMNTQTITKYKLTTAIVILTLSNVIYWHLWAIKLL